VPGRDNELLLLGTGTAMLGGGAYDARDEAHDDATAAAAGGGCAIPPPPPPPGPPAGLIMVGRIGERLEVLAWLEAA